MFRLTVSLAKSRHQRDFVEAPKCNFC